MQLTGLLTIASIASLGATQTLTIPTRVGTKNVLNAPRVISGSVDLGNQEFDRGRICALDVEYGGSEAVFILEKGAKLSNVIIGINQKEGIHCKGACTLENVWFRDVCDEGISLIGDGDVVVQGGGVASSADRIIQHQGTGLVSIKDYTVVSSRNLYRSCGNCVTNGKARHVIVTGLKANQITSDVVGINSNFGDTATISGSCGTGVKNVCQEFKGTSSKGQEALKLSTKASCQGTQGKLATLPAC